MRLTAKAQVTIPKKYRVAVGLKPGDEVDFSVGRGNVLVLRRTPVDFARWIGAGGSSSAGAIDRGIRRLRGRR